jgi:putative glycerol-1-phosphate prenyltransferase
VKENNYTTKNSQLFIFVGGSQLKDSVCTTVARIKQLTSLPVVMFPGDASQFADNADALLFLSLVSGRNAKYLIEQHIEASRAIKSSGVECISTGYILVDGGKLTAVARVSHTEPYPVEDVNLITDTALACQLLGHKMVYLEAGSGANNPVPQNVIKATREVIDIPLIVGGGIKTPEMMQSAFNAGADLVVVGNHIESHPEELTQILNTLI